MKHFELKSLEFSRRATISCQCAKWWLHFGGRCRTDNHNRILGPNPKWSKRDRPPTRATLGTTRRLVRIIRTLDRAPNPKSNPWLSQALFYIFLIFSRFTIIFTNRPVNVLWIFVLRELVPVESSPGVPDTTKLLARAWYP
jgi:hypothetical protein